MTSIITIARVFIRISKQGRLSADDFVLFLAVAVYFTMTALYIADMQHMYPFLAYTAGEVEYSDDISVQYSAMMRYNFGVTCFFWTILWAVKASLLLFFRRIIKYTDWMRVWWGIVIFTALTYVGCIISQFTSCDTIHDFTTLGM